MAQNKLILGVAAVAVVAVGAGFYFSQNDAAQSNDAVAETAPSVSTPPPAAQDAAPTTATVSNVQVTMDGPIAIMGAPDAPVTVIEYASMTCSHCASFHSQHFDAIKQAYIDTGKVKFEFRPFPLDGLALRASAVAACGGPGKFFAYTKTFFNTQDNWAYGGGDKIEAMANIARLGGMSRADFDACIEDQELLKTIVDIRADGIKTHKINSTPSFVIDGEMIAGEMSLAAFASHVDPLLPADEKQ